jgi:hypothetical protein
MITAYRQFELKAGDSRLVCWLKLQDGLREQVRLTLKEKPDVVWTVVRIYNPVLYSPPDIRWRVGGLQ